MQCAFNIQQFVTSELLPLKGTKTARPQKVWGKALFWVVLKISD